MADDNPYEPPSPESQQADADLSAEKVESLETSRRFMRLALGGVGLMLLIPASIAAFFATCAAVAFGTGGSANSIYAGMTAGVVVVVLLCYFAVTMFHRKRKR
jgi:FtsH-binding integral membrane protein